jgi:hypothetical protein
VCLTDFVKIKVEAACSAAATAVGKTFGSPNPTNPRLPSGCFLNTYDNWVNFNPHPTGAGWSNYQPLCIGNAAQRPTRNP